MFHQDRSLLGSEDRLEPFIQTMPGALIDGHCFPFRPTTTRGGGSKATRGHRHTERSRQGWPLRGLQGYALALETMDTGRLPRGTVTFLFTDIEGSTRLLGQLAERYGAVLEEHHAILRDVLTEAGG